MPGMNRKRDFTGNLPGVSYRYNGIVYMNNRHDGFELLRTSLFPAIQHQGAYGIYKKGAAIRNAVSYAEYLK